MLTFGLTLNPFYKQRIETKTHFSKAHSLVINSIISLKKFIVNYKACTF